MIIIICSRRKIFLVGQWTICSPRMVIIITGLVGLSKTKTIISVGGKLGCF
jgi:hypothetical protein